MDQQKSDISIRITQLSLGVHAYHFEVQPSDLGLNENFRQQFSVDIELERSNRHFTIKAEIVAPASFTCDRCLREFDQTIECTFKLVYQFDENGAGNIPAEELRIIHPETPYINLTEDVREMMLLTVPLKLLCREECLGLCPQCGKNKNIEPCSCSTLEPDDRWDGLKRFLNQ